MASSNVLSKRHTICFSRLCCGQATKELRYFEVEAMEVPEELLSQRTYRQRKLSSATTVSQGANSKAGSFLFTLVLVPRVCVETSLCAAYVRGVERKPSVTKSQNRRLLSNRGTC